jgi:hypothetical protein
MQQRALRNVSNCLYTNVYSYLETSVSNCLYTNVYSYLETSGGISYNPYLNVVHFFNARVHETSVAA